MKESTSSPHQSHGIQWKTPNAQSLQCSSPNRMSKKKSPILPPESEALNHVMIQHSPKLNNLQYQDQAMCVECNDNACRISNHCSMISEVIENIENCQSIPFDQHFIEDVSPRVRSSPIRSSVHRISTPQRIGSPSDIGLPIVNQKRKNIDDTLIIINNDLNASVRNRSIEESDSFPQTRWKGLDESSDANSSISPMRRNDPIMNNDLNSSLSSLGRNDGNMNTSLSPRKRKDVDDSNVKPKILDNSIHSNESMSARRKILEESSPLRRKYIDDSALVDSESGPMNQSRRSNTENTYLNNSVDQNFHRMNRDDSMFKKDVNVSIRKKNIEENNSACNFAAIKRKGIDESILLNSDLNLRGRMFDDIGLIEDPDIRRKYVEDALMLINDVNDPSMSPLRRKALDEQMFRANQANIGKLDLVHMMQHNARYSDNFLNVDDDLNEASLATQSEGSRRGIIGGVCIAPDLRYEPVEGFNSNNMPECENDDSTNHVAPIHMRCCSDSNTMDSGWQSGSEKHATD